MKDIITVAVVNFKVDAENKSSNLERICAYIENAAKQGAELVLFPEMCLYGYDYYTQNDIALQEKIKTAETIHENSCNTLAALTKKCGIYAVVGMAERPKKEGPEVLYNTAVAFGPRGLLGAYRKIHPYGAENSWCEKGSEPFMMNTEWGPIGIGICYDTYQFPELMRYYVSKGARLYLNPTAEFEQTELPGSRQSFLNYYKTCLEYGVICNSIFIASANLTGYDKTTYFGGGSCILGPKFTPFIENDVEYYAGSPDETAEGIYMATIDLSRAKRSLCVENPFTGEPDYRPEIYKNFK